MHLSIIVAMTNDRVIGQNGKIPWHYPEDMRWFKERTMGSTVIMGRKTWESLNYKPLDGRNNIVVSQSLLREELLNDPLRMDMVNRGEKFFIYCIMDNGKIFGWAPDIERALDLIRFIDLKHAWFIGGERIYKEALDLAQTMFITRVPNKVTGDNLTYFPKYDERNWETTACLFTDTPDLYFMQYKRKK